MRGRRRDVEDAAYVGSGALLREHVVVGSGRVIGMGAVVTRSVPAGEVWAGVPGAAAPQRLDRESALLMSQPTLFARAGRALAPESCSTRCSARLGTLAIGIALARILGPDEFGTFAVALLALLAVLSFNELGVSLAIVRWPDSPREIAPTVATLATLSSVLLAVVVRRWQPPRSATRWARRTPRTSYACWPPAS